jgi:hypothetical protein
MIPLRRSRGLARKSRQPIDVVPRQRAAYGRAPPRRLSHFLLLPPRPREVGSRARRLCRWRPRPPVWSLDRWIEGRRFRDPFPTRRPRIPRGRLIQGAHSASDPNRSRRLPADDPARPILRTGEHRNRANCPARLGAESASPGAIGPRSGSMPSRGPGQTPPDRMRGGPRESQPARPVSVRPGGVRPTIRLLHRMMIRRQRHRTPVLPDPRRRRAAPGLPDGKTALARRPPRPQ